MPARRFALLLLTTILAPFGGPAEGQDEPLDPAGDLFVEEVRVDLVDVQVWVTDRDGNPVHGLTIEDFEVAEDGDPVQVTNFYEVMSGEAVVPRAPAAPAAQPVELPTPIGAPAPSPLDRRLHLVVYVDNFNLRPENRRWALMGVRRFVSRALEPDDRVMVVSYDRGLHVRLPFTSNPDAVSDAFEEIDKLTGAATARDFDRRQALELIDEARRPEQALAGARQYANFVATETRLGLEGLIEVIGNVAGLSGRKAVLHVSDGMPLRAGEDLFMAVQDKFQDSTALSQAAAYDLKRRYDQIGALANSNSVTLYQLDARGNSAGLGVDASDASGADTGSRHLVTSTRVQNTQAPLHILAEHTGGQAITNTNALDDGLRRITADFRSYYALGYAPRHYGDGRYHDIDVRVKDRSLTIRHRNGYRDKSADARLREGTVAAAHYGDTKNPLGIVLWGGRPETTERGDYRIPLEIRIPLDRVTLIPRGGRYVGQVSLTLMVTDTRGDASPVREQEPLTIEVPSELIDEARSKYYTYAMEVVLGSGLQRVAVGVRDQVSGDTSFVVETVNLD